MMTVKKDFVKELLEEEKVRYETAKAFMIEKKVNVFISKEVVGKGQLGLDIVAWVLIMSREQMIIKKDIQEKPAQLLEVIEKMASDYDYE